MEQPVVSSRWIEQSTNPFIPVIPPGQYEPKNLAYGYYWWLDTLHNNSHPVNTIQALGMGGQALILLPEFDMVVVITGSNYNRQPKLDPTTIIENYILPAENYK